MTRMHLSDMAGCVTLFYRQNEHSRKFISLFRKLGRGKKKKKNPLSLKDHDYAKHRALLKSSLGQIIPGIVHECECNPSLLSFFSHIRIYLKLLFFPSPALFDHLQTALSLTIFLTNLSKNRSKF